MAMSPRLMRPRTTLHPEAAAWRSAVVANSGSVSGSTLSAVDKFCKSIDAANIRNRFYRLSLLCGTGLNACLVPLYRGPSRTGTQYGNATDTNSGGLFVSANYTESVGLSTTNSTGQYLNTGLAPNSMELADVQAMHISVSHGPIASGDYDPRPIGAHSTTDRFSFVLSVRSSAAGSMGLCLGRTNQVNSTAMASGLQPSASWVGSRTSSTSLSLYKNGALDASLSTSVTGIAAPSYPFYVCRLDNSGGLLGDSINMAHRHYSIGASMTSTEVAAYQSALNAFMSAVGRTS